MSDAEYTADRALSKVNELAEIVQRALKRERGYALNDVAADEIDSDLAKVESMLNPWCDYQTG